GFEHVGFEQVGFEQMGFEHVGFELVGFEQVVCDWLSHCEDTLMVIIPETTGKTTRTFTVKFRPLTNTKFIRFMYYVEYFKPLISSSKTEDTISFELENIYLVDDKYVGDKCEIENLCKTNSWDKVGTRYVPKADKNALRVDFDTVDADIYRICIEILYDNKNGEDLKLNLNYIPGETNPTKQTLIQNVALDNNKNVVEQSKQIDNGHVQLIVPPQNDAIKMFKIIFEITYKLPSTDPPAVSIDIEITFRLLHLGDPCVIDQLESQYTRCANKGVCTGTAPAVFTCKCDDHYLGDDSLPTTNKDTKTCIVSETDAKVYQCNCPRTDFHWATNGEKCVRNSYTTRGEICYGTNCPIFDAQVLPFTHKDLPVFTDDKPIVGTVYYSDKSNEKLTLEADVDKDVCVKPLSYQITKTSSLGISAGDMNPIAFKTTLFNGVNDWFDSTSADVCLSHLTPGADKNHLTLKSVVGDNGLVAVKWTQLVTGERKAKDPLKYLTHWFHVNDKDFNFETQWPVSDWIDRPEGKYNLRFAFTDKSKTPYSLQPILFDNNMKQINLQLIDDGPAKDKTGKVYCAIPAVEAESCTPLLDNRFMCECKANRYWDFKDFTADAPTCVCSAGYINQIIDQPNVEIDCVPENPCNKGPNPCSDTQAVCVPYGANDYMCNCPNGYSKRIGATEAQSTCQALQCLFPGLNKCQQKCTPDATVVGLGYKCECGADYTLNADGNTCTCLTDKPNCVANSNTYVKSSGAEPVCRDGLKLNEKKDQCLPNHEYDPRDICENGLDKTVPEDQPIKCLCEGPYVLNTETNTCKLAPICAPDAPGGSDCKIKNGYCVYQSEDNAKKYKCVCDAAHGMNDLDVCVNKCDTKLTATQALTGSEECRKANALSCNPLLYTPGIKPNIYCECESGYEWNGDRCSLIGNTGQFSIEFKPMIEPVLPESGIKEPVQTLPGEVAASFNPLFRYDVSLETSFKSDLNRAAATNQDRYNTMVTEFRRQALEYFLRQQLAQMLVDFKYIHKSNVDPDDPLWTIYGQSIHVKQCSLDAYKCDIAITLLDNIENKQNIGEFIRMLCVDSTTDNECNLLNEIGPNTAPIEPSLTTDGYRSRAGTDKPLFSMVLDKTKLTNTKLGVYNNCGSGTDLCGQYSKCKSAPDSSQYTCECPTKGFNITGYREIPVVGKTSIKLPICGLKDNRCDDCLKIDNNDCKQLAPKYIEADDLWTAPVHCECKSEHKVKGDQCVGVCDGVQCNRGKCVPKGKNGNACLCDGGWSGDKCETEKADPPLGGWIAGISVLAVVCLVLIVVAFIFFKR
ncbi:unnamed protein product, partial [Medioppia subpectinata]